MNVPIPFPHVDVMPDERLVPQIQLMVPLETAEFFYGKAAPIFIKLFKGYYTDCNDVIEFIDDFYLSLMYTSPVAHTRKIDGFAFKCMFKNWIGKLALLYCYHSYRMKEKVRVLLNEETVEHVDVQLKENVHGLDHRDVQMLLDAMPCKNYRDLIQMVYVDGMSLDEVAIAMDVSLGNLYNMHRRAKLQYIQVYNKEMRA